MVVAEEGNWVEGDNSRQALAGDLDSAECLLARLVVLRGRSGGKLVLGLLRRRLLPEYSLTRCWK